MGGGVGPLSLDTLERKSLSPIHATPITSVAALPVLMEREAVTPDGPDLLVTASVDSCWPSDWAAECVTQ